eukprot:g53246.t1
MAMHELIIPVMSRLQNFIATFATLHQSFKNPIMHINDEISRDTLLTIAHQVVNIGLQVVSPKLVTREEVQQVSDQQRAELANSLVTFYEIQRANAITAAGLMGIWNPPAVASTTTTSTGSNSVASSTLKPPAKRQKSSPVPKPSKQEKVEKTYDPTWTARESRTELLKQAIDLGLSQEPECFQTRISDSRGASANNRFNQGMKLYRAAIADFNTASETDSSLRRPVEPPSGGREGEDVTYRDAFSAWVLQRKNHIITYMQKNSGQSSIWTDEAACEAMFDLHRGSLVGEEFAQESSSRFRSSTASSESSASSDDTGFVRKTGRDRDGTKIGRMVSHVTQANKLFHERISTQLAGTTTILERVMQNPQSLGTPQAAAAAPVKVPTIFGDITNEALGYLKKDRASIKSLLLVYVPVDSIDPADLNELSESLLCACRISSIGQLASICISCDSVGGLVRELRDTAPDGTWHLGVITVLLQALEDYLPHFLRSQATHLLPQ